MLGIDPEELSLLGTYKGLKHRELGTDYWNKKSLLGTYKGLKPGSQSISPDLMAGLLGTYKGLKPFKSRWRG